MAVGQSTAGFSAALKEVYLPGIREELNEKTNLLDLFTEGDLTQYEWSGNWKMRVEFPNLRAARLIQ